MSPIYHFLHVLLGYKKGADKAAQMFILSLAQRAPSESAGGGGGLSPINFENRTVNSNIIRPIVRNNFRRLAKAGVKGRACWMVGGQRASRARPRERERERG